MKQVTLDHYEHEMDYSEWQKSSFYVKNGFHKLKDQQGTWIRIGNSSLFLTSLDASSLPMKEAQISAPAPTIGISEDALLAALAIAQNPALAPQLLALRKSS